MSNYKLEVENTEKLKNDINSAFTEINTELKKDDDLIANDLFDVDRCIGELKGSRKKWASGGYAGITDVGGGNFILDLNNLDFEPSFILVNNYMKSIDTVGKWYWGADQFISINLEDDFYLFGGEKIWRLGEGWFYQEQFTNDGHTTKISVTDSKMKDVNLLKEEKQVKIFAGSNNTIRDIKWYAFE